MSSAHAWTASRLGRIRRVAGMQWALLGLSLAALLAVVMWGASPYARYLHHEYQPDSAAGQLAALALFLVAWTLMIVAMMLPTAAGLLGAFAQLTRRRAARWRLELLVVAGFLGIWLAVGYALRVSDIGVHAAVDAIDALGQRPQLLGAAALLLAGGYQFSSIKYRCLTACRTPTSFLYRHWHGEHAARDALYIGAAYGRSCVGCCWALTLVMFALGSGSLAWMLGLGLFMSIEKAAGIGRELTVLVGVVLVAAGAWVGASG